MDLAYCKKCWENLVEEFKSVGDYKTISMVETMTRSIGAEETFKRCGFERFSDDLQEILKNALLYVESIAKEEKEN